MFFLVLTVFVSVYAVNAVPCLESQFKCKNGGCIPKYGVCDSYRDCKDGSDEEGCGKSEVYQVIPSSSDARAWTPNKTEAVTKAAEFFLSKMTENGWGDFTPRAVIALSFAGKEVPFSEETKALIVKQLNIHLTAGLLHKKFETLDTLSQYINSLYATCQDPRNFHGRDLVDILRSKTNVAMKSNFNHPSALLTLCIANRVDSADLNFLAEMYARSDRKGVKALVIMAMACIRDKTGHVTHHMEDFFRSSDQFIQDADIYNKALYLQAAHAAGFASRLQLRSLQLPDGSFGDMLATYSAVPVLLHSSLLDLRCNFTRREGLNDRSHFTNKGKKLIYTVWVTSDTGINTHSLTLRFEGNLTLYDVMRMAEASDPLFSFLCDETDDGKRIYSLAGIPNDAESEKSWVLYEATVDTVTVNTTDYMVENRMGVDKIYLGDKNHFLFWLK